MTFVIVRTRFEGTHCWPQAPLEVSYLRFQHRHEFHVELKIEVRHDDRELEFILLKKDLRLFLGSGFNKETDSCEAMAKSIIEWAKSKYGLGRFYSCAVFEDGENGAQVE